MLIGMEESEEDLHFYYESRGGDGSGTYDVAAADYRRELSSTGRFIAFQMFRILLPLMIFAMCFWCHDSSRRRRREEAIRQNARVAAPGSSGQHMEEEATAQDESRNAMLAETLVIKGVLEADEENPPTSRFGDRSVVKGDIYIPKKLSMAAAVSSVPISTRLMEDPFENENDEPPTCSICMVEYEVGETVCWSPNPECTHAFHWECIGQWLLKHDECPQCRNNYLIKSREAVDEGRLESDGIVTASSTFSSMQHSSLGDETVPAAEWSTSTTRISLTGGGGIGSGNGGQMFSSVPPSSAQNEVSREVEMAPQTARSCERGGSGGDLRCSGPQSQNGVPPPLRSSPLPSAPRLEGAEEEDWYGDRL